MTTKIESSQVINVLGKPVQINLQTGLAPATVKVNVYTDVAPSTESINRLLSIIYKIIPDTRIAILRDSLITGELWNDKNNTQNTIHIVFTTIITDPFIILTNKLVNKHGIMNVIFVGYDFQESDKYHLDEMALWTYETFCNHPTSLKNLERVLENMYQCVTSLARQCAP